MVWYFLLAVLAAIGLMSAGWAAFGWLLPPCREDWLVCPGRHRELQFVNLYIWLRSLGFLRCRLIVLDLGLDAQECSELEAREIEVCPPAQLPERLGMGVETN